MSKIVKFSKKGSKKVTKKIVKRSYKKRSYGLSDFFKNEPFPPMRRYKFVYEDEALIYAGTYGKMGTEFIMSLNSLYNPRYSSGGHQPYGYDQLMTIYNHYKVLGVKAEITFVDPSADGMSGAVMIQAPDDPQTLTGFTTKTCAERSNVRTINISNSGSQTKIIKFYSPIGALAGVTKLQFDANSEDFTSVYNASPNRQCLLRISVATVDETANITPSLNVRVRLTLYSQLNRRFGLASS